MGGLIAFIWFAAGLSVGIAACLVAIPIWRGTLVVGRRCGRYGLIGIYVAAFAGAAAIIYFTLGSRHSLASQVHEAAMAAPADASVAGAAARSMEAEVAGLEARLARDGGTPADWTLLAKAYDFLGRPDDASRARTRIASPGGGDISQMSVGAMFAAASATETSARPVVVAPPPSPATATELEQRVRQAPEDARSWLALAELRRAQHDDRGARDALAKVVALDRMTAQSWADYADVLASLAGGSLGGAAGSAIDSALAMDPGNAKALWLKASQAHEQHHFADALNWWKKLRSAVPANSPDARIIDGNLAEDTSLAGLPPAIAPAVADVSGTVSIDARLAARVERDATLFIYAKAADSAGPPLAVLRTTAATWPVSFRLDDSMAMIPSRRLSQFDKVVVEARISRSGQATPGAGDLYVISPVLHRVAGERVTLVINREIG